VPLLFVQPVDEPSAKRVKLENPPSPLPSPMPCADDTDGDEWPFEAFCQYLCVDLLNPAWEIRSMFNPLTHTHSVAQLAQEHFKEFIFS
jgi:hypothetical protein